MKKKILFAAALLPLSSTAALAAERNWTGGVDGDFHNDANWSGNAKPVSGDSALYDTPVATGNAQTITINDDVSLALFRVNTTPDDPLAFSVLQTGGIVTVTSGFQLGTTVGGTQSSYKLEDGRLNVTGGGNNAFVLANGAGESATFTQTGGTVNISGGRFGGAWGRSGSTTATMTYNISGGAFNFTSNHDVAFGWDGGMATFNQTGGDVLFDSPNKKNIYLGKDGEYDSGSDTYYYSTGTYNLSAGTLTVGEKMEMILGSNEDRGGTGIINMSGGTFNFNGTWIGLGQQGGGQQAMGSFDQTGGTFTTAAATTVDIGQATGSRNGVDVVSTWSVSGLGTTATFNGVVKVGANSGRGVFTVADGAEVAFNNTLTLGGAKGTFNLNGGTVTAKQIGGVASSDSSFIFNGGTLKAANDAEFTLITSDVDSVLVNAGGGTIDTNGVSVEIASGFSGVGDLEKIGDGMLTLHGDNSAYTGTLTVGAGGVTMEVGTVWSFLVDGTEDTALNAIIVDGGATLELYDVELRVALTNASGLSVGDTIDVIQGASGLDAAQVSVVSEDGNYAFIFLDSGKLEVTAVPEPSTYALLGAGLLVGLVALRRRKVS